MTAQPLAPSLAPRPWLSGAARPHRRLAGMAALATIADVAPAVGFAGVLAVVLTSPDVQSLLVDLVSGALQRD